MTSTSGMTSEEMTETLTGFDELAIAKHFDGFDLYTQGESRPMLLLRALAFIHKRRNLEAAEKDADAYTFVMVMPLADLYDYFEQDDEASPDDPDTESGKDDSTPAAEPSVSPSSALEPASSPPSITT